MSTVKAPPSASTVERALSEFSLSVTPEQIQQIQRYMEILLVWNEKVNLTAIRDPLEILYRHYCESMYGAIAVPMEHGRLADVGSGAGFPGLALKIMRPELEVFLVESNVKKATFLAEVIRELGLTKTTVLVDRYEGLGEELAPLEYVCARALGDFDSFLTWAASPSVSANQVVLWIGGRDLEQVRRFYAWKWQEPKLVPHSLQRFILCGVKREGQEPAAGM